MPGIESGIITEITISDFYCGTTKITLYQNLHLHQEYPYSSENIYDNVIEHISELIPNITNAQDIEALQELQNRYIELYCEAHPSYCVEHTVEDYTSRLILNPNLSLTIVDDGSINHFSRLSDIDYIYRNCNTVSLLGVMEEFVKQYCQKYPYECIYYYINLEYPFNLYRNNNSIIFTIASIPNTRLPLVLSNVNQYTVFNQNLVPIIPTLCPTP